MINPSFRKEILNEINRLGPVQQQKVLDFARALATTASYSVPGRNLLAFAGTIEEDDLQAMADAIEQDCEKIVCDEW